MEQVSRQPKDDDLQKEYALRSLHPQRLDESHFSFICSCTLIQGCCLPLVGCELHVCSCYFLIGVGFCPGVEDGVAMPVSFEGYKVTSRVILSLMLSVVKRV